MARGGMIWAVAKFMRCEVRSRIDTSEVQSSCSTLEERFQYSGFE